MKLFKTTTRHTYRKPRPRAGWSTTLTAKTRLKRWVRRSRKKLWRTAKQRIRRNWRQHQRSRRRAARSRPVARTARQFQRHHAKIHAQVTASTSGYQVAAGGAVSYQPGPVGTVEGRAKLHPQDGAMANCWRCGNEIQYNGKRERWEHHGLNPKRGHADCFKRHGI